MSEKATWLIRKLVGGKDKREEFHNSILVKIRFDEGTNGVINVVKAGLIVTETKSNSEHVDLTICDYVDWDGLQEPENLSEREKAKEPFERVHASKAFLHSFESLDTIWMSNKSRFLSEKKPCHNLGSMFDRAYADGTWGHNHEAYIVRTIPDLKLLLETLLPRIGVPKNDVEKIIQHILNKFE